MKKHWTIQGIRRLKYLMAAAALMLACIGCENDFERSSLPLEENILASEDFWVNPEGTSLITSDGRVYLNFPEGAVLEPTLFTIASIAIDDDPKEEYNTLDYGISITSTSQDLVFGEFVIIRLNYALEAFQRTSQVNEKNLTIYKMETIGTLCEREVSIGQCRVDCSGRTVQGCISEGGLYVVGELYIVSEI